MLQETPESVRSFAIFIALFTIFAGTTRVISDQSFAHPGALFALTFGAGYAYIAIRWHTLLATRPGRIRAILIANLFLTALFTIYSLLRGASGVDAFLGCALAFGATSFLLSAVGAYSRKDVTLRAKDDPSG